MENFQGGTKKEEGGSHAARVRGQGILKKSEKMFKKAVVRGEEGIEET